MVIPSETIEKVRSSLDIVEIIREYVPSLKKVGKDYSAPCPFHQEKKPSFFVSPQKNIFHCFGCQAGGDVIKFVMKYENLPYPEAIRKLADKAGIKISEIDSEANSEKKQIFEILKQCAAFYHRHLSGSAEADAARKYLAQRKISADTVENFMLGYAPENNKLVSEAAKKYDIKLLLKTGLISISERTGRPYDHLHGRVIFPIFDAFGNIIAFGGRVIPGSRVSDPPYLNTFDTAVYSKSNSLYGLYQSLGGFRNRKKAILLEGYFDVLITHQSGNNNAVAPLGTSLTYSQVGMLGRYVNELCVVFDCDQGGNSAAIRAGDICLEQDLTCRIGLLPEKMDPDEYILKFGREKFDDIVSGAKHPVEFKMNYCLTKYDLKQPEGKRDFIVEILDTVNKIKDPIIKQEMITYISSRLSVREELLLGEFQRLKFSKTAVKEAGAAGNVLKVRSVEEEIIWLCLQYPDLCGIIPSGLLGDERCARVFPHLAVLEKEDNKLTKVLDSLDEDTANWLTRLSFEQRFYDSPEKTLNVLIKDLTTRNKEEQRRNLEKEIVSMLEGSLPRDNEKIVEYQNLTKILKGSKVEG